MKALLLLGAVGLLHIAPPRCFGLDVVKSGGTCVVSELGCWVTVNANTNWVTNPPDSDDVFASLTNTFTLDDGAAKGTNSTDGVATCTVPLSAVASAPSVSAASLSISEAEGQTSWAIANAGNLGEFSGINATSVANFTVQPDLSNPGIVAGLLESTVSLIATPTENGDTAYRVAAGGGAGRFVITFDDQIGSTRLRIFDNGSLIYSMNGAGGNLVIHTAEVIGVNTTYAATATSGAISVANATGISASSCVATASAVCASTITALGSSDPIPEPSIRIVIDEETEINVPIPCGEECE